MLIPLDSRYVVKRDGKESQTKAGILLPPSSIKELLLTGVVVAVGPGGYNVYGVQKDMVLQVGDHVAFAARFAGQEVVDLDGEKYLLLQQDEIVCKIVDLSKEKESPSEGKDITQIIWEEKEPCIDLTTE